MTQPENTPQDPASTPAEAYEAADANPAAAESADQILKNVLAERDDNWNKYLRAEAELVNFRRRVNQEREEERKYAGIHLIRALLPTIDNLQRALEAGRQQVGQEQNSLLLGVEMVLQQLLETLGQHGVKPIHALGEPFDPNRHEALQQIPSADHPPMTVLQEVEKGFMMNERIVRPSKVLVSSAPQT
jgi:molecular chaperone GrpE